MTFRKEDTNNFFLICESHHCDLRVECKVHGLPCEGPGRVNLPFSCCSLLGPLQDVEKLAPRYLSGCKTKIKKGRQQNHKYSPSVCGHNLTLQKYSIGRWHQEKQTKQPHTLCLRLKPQKLLDNAKHAFNIRECRTGR